VISARLLFRCSLCAQREQVLTVSGV
jgi:hypothetical protein